MSQPFWAKLHGAIVHFPIAVCAAVLSFRSAHWLSLDLRRIEAARSHQQPAPALVTEGRALFLDSCAHCHAADATGDEGPDLHGLEVSDRYIARTITGGIKGEMPSFRKKLAGDDVRRLTAYLRSLKP